MADMRDGLEECIRGLSEKFIKNPYNFFTESDAHAYLYYYIFRSGPRELKIQYKTKDERIRTVLIHREYPTSFRYARKPMILTKNTGARGHYDLVVLNPKFVESHAIEEIIAKDYKMLPTRENNHLIAVIEFKLITKKLTRNMKDEISKDVVKLRWAIDYRHAEHAYLIIFNREGREEGYPQELEKQAKENPTVKILYLESVKSEKRHYRPIYLNDWKNKLRYRACATI